MTDGDDETPTDDDDSPVSEGSPDDDSTVSDASPDTESTVDDATSEAESSANDGAADEGLTETEDEDSEDSDGEAEISSPSDTSPAPDVGGATLGDGGTAQQADAPEQQQGYSGAPDDEEMPLTEHIREMVSRIAVVLFIMAVISAFTFLFSDKLINWLWYSFLPGHPEACQDIATATGASPGFEHAQALKQVEQTVACPRVYHPLGLVFARLKVASLVGFIVALPVFVYQTYLFMRPGLYPHERRYYLASVPTSLVLALVGVAFAYFLVLPFIFSYFLFYSQDVAQIAFGLTDTFNIILLMLGLFAAIFQIPLFIMLAIMMGVTTRRWLVSRRFYFWLGFSGFAFIFSPDPTGMAPFLVGVTMILLFEVTLLLLKWTDR
jgi:sec-independent protein translocase protein TatC